MAGLNDTDNPYDPVDGTLGPRLGVNAQIPAPVRLTSTNFSEALAHSTAPVPLGSRENIARGMQIGDRIAILEMYNWGYSAIYTIQDLGLDGVRPWRAVKVPEFLDLRKLHLRSRVYVELEKVDTDADLYDTVVNGIGLTPIEIHFDAPSAGVIPPDTLNTNGFVAPSIYYPWGAGRAFGIGAVANYSAFGIGVYAKASGPASVAIGSDSFATGAYSMALGGCGVESSLSDTCISNGNLSSSTPGGGVNVLQGSRSITNGTTLNRGFLGRNIIYDSASVGTVTLPSISTLPDISGFPFGWARRRDFGNIDAGSTFKFIQAGNGTLEVLAGSGVTIVGPRARTTGIGSTIELVATSNNIWRVRHYGPGETVNMLVPAATPSAPPLTNQIVSYARSLGGRIIPSFRSPVGQPLPYQPHIGSSNIRTAKPISNSTTVSLDGLTLTTQGTPTAVALASTNLYSSLPRIHYLAGAASNAIASFITPADFWRGNGSGIGGWHMIMRFGVADGATVATQRGFAGLRIGTTAPTDVEPSTQVSCIGLGWDSADANLQIMHNDASGPCTKVPLTGFAVPTANAQAVYELILYCAPNTSGGTIGYEVNILNTATTASGTISTDLPAITAFMAALAYVSAGGTSAAMGLALFSLYIETDY